jgi:hypothetical protein
MGRIVYRRRPWRGPVTANDDAALSRTRLAVLFAASFLIYPNVFLLPCTPFLLGGDQVFFWTYAQRMLHGERPYIDFFQFTPPATDLIYLAVFRLFGARILVTSAVDVALGLALALACFSAARRLMARRLAAIVTVAYVAAIYVPLVNGTHHLFSMLVIMAALVVVMHQPTTRRQMAAGGLLALASFFSHTHGAAALLAFLAWGTWERRASGSSLGDAVGVAGLVLATYLAALLALYGYFLGTVGVRRLFECEISFVSHYMITQPTAIPGMPEALSWQRFERFVISCALPVVYPVALALAGKVRARSREESNAALLAMVGLALSLEVAASPNWLRYYSMAMPAVILGGWLVDQCGRWRSLAVSIGLVSALYVGGVHTIDRQRAAYVVSALPAGEAAVPAETDEKLQLVMRRTVPGEFFLQAIWPGLYVPLGLRNPLYVDTVGVTDSTRPEGVARAIRELDEKAVRYVLWAPYLNRPKPGNERAWHLRPLGDYIHARYDCVKTLVDGEELWERRASP